QIRAHRSRQLKSDGVLHNLTSSVLLRPKIPDGRRCRFSKETIHLHIRVLGVDPYVADEDVLAISRNQCDPFTGTIAEGKGRDGRSRQGRLQSLNTEFGNGL